MLDKDFAHAFVWNTDSLAIRIDLLRRLVRPPYTPKRNLTMQAGAPARALIGDVKRDGGTHTWLVASLSQPFEKFLDGSVGAYSRRIAHSYIHT